MATACRSFCGSLCPAWWAAGSRVLDLRFLCPGKGQECFHRPARVPSLGNCCRKFPLTAGPNLRKQCAPVCFPEILKGISEFKTCQTFMLFQLLSGPSLLLFSVYLVSLLPKSAHPLKGWSLNQDTHILQNCSFPGDMFPILNHRNIVSLFHYWVFLL